MEYCVHVIMYNEDVDEDVESSVEVGQKTKWINILHKRSTLAKTKDSLRMMLVTMLIINIISVMIFFNHNNRIKQMN